MAAETEGKRETGANPVRSRHCDGGMGKQWCCGTGHWLSGWEGCFLYGSLSQETCRLFVQEYTFQITRYWSYVFEAAFAEDELDLVLYHKKDFFCVHTDRTECLFLLLYPVVCNIF